MQGKLPAMLETTAAVRPGGSGGAIVDLDGRMVGLVTRTSCPMDTSLTVIARHGGGTVIPHLNFSIPCAALGPIFKFSEVLEDLDRPNEHLSPIWASMPSLTPKPGPSLPNLPRFQLGDNEKDIKGSRFTKFMTEKADLFQKTTQLGKMENLPNKFILNKL